MPTALMNQPLLDSSDKLTRIELLILFHPRVMCQSNPGVPMPRFHRVYADAFSTSSCVMPLP